MSLEEKLQLVLKIGPLQHWAHECLTSKSFNCSTFGKKGEKSLTCMGVCLYHLQLYANRSRLWKPVTAYNCLLYMHAEAMFTACSVTALPCVAVTQSTSEITEPASMVSLNVQPQEDKDCVS